MDLSLCNVSTSRTKSDSSSGLSSPGDPSPRCLIDEPIWEEHAGAGRTTTNYGGPGRTTAKAEGRKISDIHCESLRGLKQALEKYSDFRSELKEIHDFIVHNVDELSDVLGVDDGTSRWLKDHMETEMVPVEAFISKDPIILVSGQVNCGKSSLVNQILEKRNCVPVEKTPCTSRVTKLRYSERNYYQLFDQDGSPRGEKKDFNSKRLKKDIELQSRERESDAVLCTVEIGLDNPILKYGIQIYDTPGTNENEALDAVVQQALDGVLQVLIYVIDANRSLSEQVSRITHISYRKFIWYFYPLLLKSLNIKT